MLSEELKTRRVPDRREEGGAATPNGHGHPQPPLVINSHFIVSDFHPLREDPLQSATNTAVNEGPQSRWEENARSTRTEQGSVSSTALDANLVLQSTEYRSGIVIRRFRTSHRVEADAETKSVSNRSMVSESSHLNSVSFRPFKPAEDVGELVLKPRVAEAVQVQDDTKSEQMGVGSSVQQDDAIEPPMPPQKVHVQPQVSDDLVIQHKLNGFGAKHVHGNLDGLGLETTGRDHVRAHCPPFKPAANLSDPRTTSGMLKGEIAEADLLLENLGRFEGELVDGRMHGYGRLFDQQNRLLFEGDFVDNEYEGVGILHNQLPEGTSGLTGEVDWTAVDWRALAGLWTRYEGLFKGGRFHGAGNLFFGTRYALSSIFENGEVGREVLAQDLVAQRAVRVRRDSGRPSKSN